MRHLDEGTIHAWLDGALDEEAERKAEEHAARCTECAVAVADARGMIAAASRILTALDDVPGGVLPEGSRAAPLSAPVRGSAAAVRRLPMWTLKVAASVAVVATGTFVVVRTLPRRPAISLAAKDQSALPPGVTLRSTPAVPPAIVPEQATPTSAAVPGSATRDTEALEKKKADLEAKSEADAAVSADAKLRQQAAAAGTGGAAGAPAAPPPAGSVALSSNAAAPAPARAMPAPRAAPAESTPGAAADSGPRKELAQVDRVSEAQKTEPAMQRAASAPATGGRINGLVSDELPAGVRLLSQQQTKEDAGVLERRVYELRPGVDVVLAILSAPARPSAEERGDVASASRDSMRRKILLDQAGANEAAGLNSIQWTDSAGTEFTLSGPVSLDSLRTLRARLPIHRP